AFGFHVGTAKADIIAAHYGLPEPARRVALVDLVLEEADGRGRRRELAVDLARYAAVLDHLAVAELDLERLRLGVVARRADPAGIDALALHGVLLQGTGSQCSITSSRAWVPLNSLTHTRYAARILGGSGSSALKRIASSARPPRTSRSLVCFSPTTRWPATSNSSQNSGCGKPWPQIWRSSICASARSRKGASSEPSVSMVRARAAGGRSSCTTASKSS